MFKSLRAVWTAGILVIVAGIVCLVLSDKMLSQGWWQGTTQAFGVGFIVGGLVDVLAISWLNQLTTQAQEQARQIAGMQGLQAGLAQQLKDLGNVSGATEDEGEVHPGG